MHKSEFPSIDEDDLFDADFREDDAPSRRSVVLRSVVRATNQEKRANRARFTHRATSKSKAKGQDHDPQ